MLPFNRQTALFQVAFERLRGALKSLLWLPEMAGSDREHERLWPVAAWTWHRSGSENISVQDATGVSPHPQRACGFIRTCKRFPAPPGSTRNSIILWDGKESR